ncbi:hypothetical protein PYCCODRAFT_1439737 [Trametes coccinea BRFM310]|uniref:Uncharacterized protein n=1 Tax=Trametes coccinea (strain BRFM310) TaxID=1353009 RepID=A0A1Y2IB53_TRAC3|nr:hypothetical protein PYCCODRAFT_1439737 [Trametes coccinea BRFM310]
MLQTSRYRVPAGPLSAPPGGSQTVIVAGRTSTQQLSADNLKPKILTQDYVVADALESFTYTFLRALLTRRKRDGELTRDECGLLRLLRTSGAKTAPDVRGLLRQQLRAMQLAGKNRLPGVDVEREQRGVLAIVEGVFRLLQVHEQAFQDEALVHTSSQPPLNSEEGFAATAVLYETYIRAFQEMKDRSVNTTVISPVPNIEGLQQSLHGKIVGENRLPNEMHDTLVKGSCRTHTKMCGKENVPLARIDYK